MRGGIPFKSGQGDRVPVGRISYFGKGRQRKVAGKKFPPVKCIFRIVRWAFRLCFIAGLVFAVSAGMKLYREYSHMH